MMQSAVAGDAMMLGLPRATALAAGSGNAPVTAAAAKEASRAAGARVVFESSSSVFGWAQQGVAGAAVCGLVLALRRRSSNRKPIVARGPTYGVFHEYKFRAKPGDKYRYRYSKDKLEPEFGVPPEAEGRVLRYGELMKKGTPQGPANYLKDKEHNGALADRSAQASRGALLLDCDGTLVETERDGHRVAFNRAFKEKGLDIEWEVELYGELLKTGGGKERMTRYFVDFNPKAWPFEDPPAKDHPEIMALHELKTKLFMDIVESGALPLREGVKELLSDAVAAGWDLAVCSTSNEKAVTTIVKTLLPEYAPKMKIFAGDMVKAKKPDPEIYTMAARELGVAPMKCVVVEDSNIGLRSGKAAGMQVVVTKSIYTEDEEFDGADLIVEGLDDVDFDEDIMIMLPQPEFA
mmetsp:Transcript_11227/g.25217  ORF Transcript_11227/g.25217 Transcript_11227/m.25217 type:complete len:407 (-) Transcript_11227:57-1277(-)|eukprot:CAMPEP_0170603084 /NCGR_PEP_ID=MMETSP0224-20130122/18729_1 /TAXON_ID=285029 /ORGANISM="Togula jolla, Strain CCCM 725" /LENGTH=406 /DNA_ID=CAMNT_0010927953 /DNA_START=54 /DNA_END=1274 /DNA_ORIENTATION=-